jgi:hypothetical protein
LLAVNSTQASSFGGTTTWKAGTTPGLKGLPGAGFHPVSVDEHPARAAIQRKLNL